MECEINPQTVRNGIYDNVSTRLKSMANAFINIDRNVLEIKRNNIDVNPLIDRINSIFKEPVLFQEGNKLVIIPSDRLVNMYLNKYINTSHNKELKKINKALIGEIDPLIEEKYFPTIETTTKSILTKIANSDHPLNKLAAQLLPYTDIINIPIYLLEKEDLSEDFPAIKSEKNIAGVYSSNKEIYIAKYVKFKGFGSEPTIIHEIIHAYTHKLIDNTAYKQKLADILEYLKKYENKISDVYGLTNEHELVTEFFTNSSFARDLMKIPPQGKFNNYKNLWEELFDYVMNLFDFSPQEKNLYTEIYPLMTNIIDLGVKFYSTNITDYYNEINTELLEAEELPISEEDINKVWNEALDSETENTLVFPAPASENPTLIETSFFYKGALPTEFERKTRGNFNDNEIASITLNKLVRKLLKIHPDLKIKIISQYELDQSEHIANVNDINSFIKDDIVYLVRGRYDLKSTIEEILHPFVKTLELQNNELFNNIFNAIEGSYRKDYEFYKKLYGEEVAKNEVVTKALRDKYLDNSIYQQFLNWIKQLFKNLFPKIDIKDVSPNTSFNQLADMLIQDGLDFKIDYVTNPYYNLTDGEKWVENSFNKLSTYAVEKGLIKVGNDEGYTLNGKPIRRISELAQKYVENFFRNKGKYDESRIKSREVAAEEGTNIHNALEIIFYKFIDKATGLRKNNPNNLKYNNTNVNDDMYNILLKMMEDRLDYYTNNYGPKTRFLAEVVVYNQQKKLAGTIDFIALTTDGKVHIRDWKSTQKLKYGDSYVTSKNPFPSWKRGAWDIQLENYRDAVKNTLGLKNEQFSTLRIDPILTIYDTTNTQLLGIEGSFIDKMETNRYKVPYISYHEHIENAAFGDLVEKMREILKIATESENLDKDVKYAFNYQLDNHIENTIQDFRLNNTNIEPLLVFHEDIKNKLNELLLKINLFPELTTDNVKYASDYINMASTLANLMAGFKNFSRELYGFNLEKSYLSDVEKEALLKDRINGLNNSIDKIQNEISKQRNRLVKSLMENSGLKYVEAEKQVSGFNKLFTSTSTPLTATVGLLYKFEKMIHHKTALMWRSMHERFQNLEYDIKKENKNYRESIDLLVNKKKGTLISKFKHEFFADEDKAFKESFLAAKNFVIQNYRWEDLVQERQKIIREKIKELDQKPYIENNEQLRNAEIEKINKFYNVEISLDALMNIPTSYLKESVEFQNKYWTEEYKKITKSPALFKLYKNILEINELAAEAGAISRKQKFTFLPKMPKMIGEEGISALNPKKAWERYLENIRVKSDKTFGTVNISTGEVETRHFSFSYVEDIFGGDYKDMSFDLPTIYSIFYHELIEGRLLKDIIPLGTMLETFEGEKKVRPIDSSGALLHNSRDGSLKDMNISNRANLEYFSMQFDALIFGRRLQNKMDKKFTINTKIKKWNNETKKYEDDVEERHYSWARILQEGIGFLYKNTFMTNVTTPIRQYFASLGHMTFAAGRHFNGNDWIKNESTITALIRKAQTNEINDIKALAIEYLMPFLDNELIRKSRNISSFQGNKIFNPDNITFMAKSTQMTQSVLSLSILDNMIVVDGKVVNVYDYIRKKYSNLYDNETLESRKNMKNEELLEIESLKKNNSVYKYFTIKEKDFKGKKVKYLDLNLENQEEEREKIVSLIQYYSKIVTGENTKGDFYGYKSYMISTIFGMYRNWIPRTTAARLGKFKFNEDLGNFEWGRWHSLFNTLSEAYKENKLQTLKFLFGINVNEELIKFAREKYNDLKIKLNDEGSIYDLETFMSEREFIDFYINNYKKTLIEGRWLTVMLMISVSAVLAPSDDDDDQTKEVKRFLQFNYERLYDEYSFYVNPRSFTDLLGNSVPAINYVVNLMTAFITLNKEGLYTITGDEEELEKNKTLKYWMRAVPISSQLMRYYGMFDPELTKELGIKPFTLKNF